MTKQTKITYNLQGLDDLRKEIGDSYIARVGILGGAAQEREEYEVVVIGKKKYLKKKVGIKQDLSNSEVGVIQEFGSEKAHIPPRSFLRMPIAMKGKELVKAITGNMAKAAFEKGNIKGIFKILGVAGELIVDDAFNTSGFGQWKPLADSTIRQKGSSKPLIDTSQLRRSISSDVKRKGEA